MARQLRDFQIEDGDIISKRQAALVGHEPRVGKTNIAIRAADNVDAHLVVVVCPAAVKENWRAAIEEFRTGSWTAVVVSYNKAPAILKALRHRIIDVLIVDEAHYCKERGTARTKAVLGTTCERIGGLAEKARRVYCLTGTPMPNNPSELWPMLRALAPQLIDNGRGKPMSFSSFRDKYCAMVNTPYGTKISGSRNYRELREKLKGFMIRRTRQEVFGRDLQPATNVYVTADKTAMKELKALENSEQGQLVMKALQSDNPMKALARVEKQVVKLRKLFGLAKVPGIAQLVKEELDAEPGAKIVLFGFHHDVIDALRVALKDYGAQSFDGRTSDARKLRVQSEFKENPKCRVVIGQLQAMGVGLDFSMADNVIFCEWSYVPTDNEQASARIFNMNSPEPKFVRYAILINSLDKEIRAAAEKKAQSTKRILTSVV